MKYFRKFILSVLVAIENADEFVCEPTLSVAEKFEKLDDISGVPPTNNGAPYNVWFDNV